MMFLGCIKVHVKKALLTAFQRAFMCYKSYTAEMYFIMAFCVGVGVSLVFI